MNKKRFLIWEKWRGIQHSIELKELQQDLASRGLATSGIRNQAEKHLKDKYLSEIGMERASMEAEEVDLQERVNERNSQRRTNWIVACGSFLAALGSVGSMVLALPLFNQQINNIQVKVDSLQESLNSMYSRYETDVFTREQIMATMSEGPDNGVRFEVELTNEPIENSLNIFWAPAFISPTMYEVVGKKVILNVPYINPQQIREYPGPLPLQISYFRKIQ